MPFLLPADCLNEVFENLEDDKTTLYSCLLVSRFWCKISVRILWRDIWGYKYSVPYNRNRRRSEMDSSVLSTLISCLPNESKELLCKNEIFISTPTSNSPLFNYASFCKVLSVDEISQIIHGVIYDDISSQNLKDKNYLITKEMLKMFMSQVSSLKSLTRYNCYYFPNNIPFTSFPGARDCLTYLSELHCNSSDINYQLSQICHNLRSLTIYFKTEVSEGLKELVSSQNNLKYLKLTDYGGNNWTTIIPALMKHSNTLTKLHLYSDYFNLSSASFVSLFLNLQEITFSLSRTQFGVFKELQYVSFSKLKTLKFPYGCPKSEYLTKFLEINGTNLKEFYINSLTSANDIAEFCPNLKKLYVLFGRNELDKLKTIFNSCQHLEGIVIQCGVFYLNENEVFETVAKYSPKNFYELKLINPELYPENLESSFVSWKNQSKKSLNLIIASDFLKVKEESMKIIEKYKNLGVIKKFETRKYGEKELFLTH